MSDLVVAKADQLASNRIQALNKEDGAKLPTVDLVGQVFRGVVDSDAM